MRFETFTFAAVAAAVMVLSGVSTPAAAADAPTSAQCLMCHGGSFDALREKTKDWKDEFDTPVQPHQYLDPKSANPHKGEKVVPECTNCHQAHPFPLPKDTKPEPATLSSCYGCHHMENFQKCSDAGCHEK